MMLLKSSLQLQLFFSFIHATVSTNSCTTATNRTTNIDAVTINRRLEASIIAHQWKTNPSTPFCETFAFLDSAPPSALSHNSKQTFFQSLTSLTTATPAKDYQDAIQKATAAASVIVELGREEKLLEYALATRAHAPFCEMHDSLARAARAALDVSLASELNMKNPMAFVVQIVTINEKNKGVAQLLYAQDVNQNGQIQFIPLHKMEIDHTVEDTVWAHPLPDEQLFLKDEKKGKDMKKDNQSRENVVVLYGAFDSREFAALYHALLDQAIPFVVRHMHVNNDSSTGENLLSSEESMTRLQGYGVRLDIRNVEYTSFDDKADVYSHSDSPTTTTPAESTQNSNGPILESNPIQECHEEKEWTMEEMKQRLANGIDPALLCHPTPFLRKFFESYLPHLEPMMNNADYASFQKEKDQVFIPPREELTQLALQATTVISQSQDPLWTMMVLTQNLPSFAAFLGNITVPFQLKEQALEMERILKYREGSASPSGTGIMEFHVNGRNILVERPSFNVFELINVIREEKELLRSIDSLRLGREMSGVVANFLSIGKHAFESLVTQDGLEGDDEEEEDERGMGMMNVKEPKLRIDVGSGYKGAVVYLNDIERDVEYQQWPNKIEQALYGMQFGGPLVIRRNILTMLLVMDPFDEENRVSDVLRLMMELMQKGTPIRVGILFVSNKDIDACRAHVESRGDSNGDCLQFVAPSKENKSIMESTATSEMIMKIYQYVVKTYDKSIGFPYLFLLSDGLENGMTVHDIVSAHAQTLMRMGIPAADPMSDIIAAIKVGLSPDSKTERYAKAVKFAVMKNIRPGMAFVNGIPLSTKSPQDCQDILMEEMQRVVGKMLSGKITDSSPRSIYAMLLKGDNVHSVMHPLLADDLPEYRILSSTDNALNLVVLQDTADSERPRIVITIVADLLSSDGLENLSSSLSSIHKYITKSTQVGAKGQSAIAMRIVPNTLESSCSILGTLFRGASRFQILELIDLVGSALKTDIANAMLTMDDLDCSQSARQLANDVIKGDECSEDAKACDFEPISDEFNTTVAILVNGRVFIPTSTIHAKDIDILIDLEQGAAKTITKRLAKYAQGPSLFVAVSKTAQYLGNSFSSHRFNANKRSDIFAAFEENHESDLLRFGWNAAKGGREEALEVKVTVVLDPLTDAAQRAAPLIRIIRDTLALPLEVILAPRLVLDEDSKIPLTSYYRFVAEPSNASNMRRLPNASFIGLPTNQIFTIRMDVPEPWDIQQSSVVQDTDNLRCDAQSCGDNAYAYSLSKNNGEIIFQEDITSHLTKVEYGLNSLLFFGQCYDVSDKTPPNGLQLTITDAASKKKAPASDVEILSDGSVSEVPSHQDALDSPVSAGTLVMKTIGYWQLRSKPGVWKLDIAEGTRGAEIYDLIEGTVTNGRLDVSKDGGAGSKLLMMKDFVNRMEVTLVKRKEGYEDAELLVPVDENSINDDDVVHVFSLATGHLYERFLKIMMLSVTKRTSSPVKFWLLENFLSPSFKVSAFAMAEKIGCQVEFVTYKWPEWLRGQSEKQRIIWGYKILFLDVLFPLDLKKIIYVDADQVVRGDLKELWDIDLEGAPYGYTPMCESREETKGYQFWREGFWPSHLRGRPYHISALYVVDLERFRRELVGDQLRAVYQQLTSDPNNLSNLDQDLPNYTQHEIKIFSLPQDWLWCESWCSEETKATAKTIDLCNNPQHKEPKVSMAKRIISGELFDESWIELDTEIDKYEKQTATHQQIL